MREPGGHTHARWRTGGRSGQPPGAHRDARRFGSVLEDARSDSGRSRSARARAAGPGTLRRHRSMTSPEGTLAGLKRQRPEWAPWLALVEEVVRESAGSRWDPVVRAIQPGRNGSPLLDRAAIPVPDALVSDLLRRLV